MKVERKYWPNGQLKWEHPNNKWGYHGMCRGWHENGQLRYEEFYKNGKSYGAHKVWSEDGLLLMETQFEDDKQHGIYRYKWGNEIITRYFLYDEEVSEEEYRKYQLIEQLADLK